MQSAPGQKDLKLEPELSPLAKNMKTEGWWQKLFEEIISNPSVQLWNRLNCVV